RVEARLSSGERTDIGLDRVSALDPLPLGVPFDLPSTERLIQGGEKPFGIAGARAPAENAAKALFDQWRRGGPRAGTGRSHRSAGDFFRLDWIAQGLIEFPIQAIPVRHRCIPPLRECAPRSRDSNLRSWFPPPRKRDEETDRGGESGHVIGAGANAGGDL